MKNIAIITLIVAMVLSLNGCAKENKQQPVNNNTKQEMQKDTSSVKENKNEEEKKLELKNDKDIKKENIKSEEKPTITPNTQQNNTNNNTTTTNTSTNVALPDGISPIAPQEFQKLLGKGMDVDWSKTSDGKKFYNTKASQDFSAMGVKHVRIRVKDKADDSLFKSLDKQIDDCINNGIIPIIAYQADEFKNDPSDKNINKVVSWWGTVAQRYKDKSHLLAFDLLIEATDALNKQPERLNDIYENIVSEIRKTNPTRIVMISPRLRSDADYLKELKIPTAHNGYLMAQWHFYAAGPSKTNERKLWTTGTKEEQQLILNKINTALQWQKDTGIPTWVGAWMPGNYNDGNDYTIEEQVNFASFMTKSLTNAKIPFAVNSDTKYYDRENGKWIDEMQPVFKAIYN